MIKFFWCDEKFFQPRNFFHRCQKFFMIDIGDRNFFRRRSKFFLMTKIFFDVDQNFFCQWWKIFFDDENFFQHQNFFSMSIKFFLMSIKIFFVSDEIFFRWRKFFSTSKFFLMTIKIFFDDDEIFFRCSKFFLTMIKIFSSTSKTFFCRWQLFFRKSEKVEKVEKVAKVENDHPVGTNREGGVGNASFDIRTRKSRAHALIISVSRVKVWVLISLWLEGSFFQLFQLF